MRKKNIILHGLLKSELISFDTADGEDGVNGQTPDYITVEKVLKEGLKYDSTWHIDDVERIRKFPVAEIRPSSRKLKPYFMKRVWRCFSELTV